MPRTCTHLINERMKPCKIQGIELLNRPFTVFGKKKSMGLGKNGQNKKEETNKTT